MLKTNALIVFSCLVVSLSAHGNSSCSEKASSGVDPWVATDGSVTMALRSNACHYWSWASKHASEFISQDLLKQEALITGDPHHENFSHIFSEGRRVYVLNDIDDVGMGPVLLDVIKFLGVSRSVSRKESELSTKKMLKAYITGIKEREKAYSLVAEERLPKMLLPDFEVTQEQARDDYYRKIDKATDNDGGFEKDDHLSRWKKMDDDQQRHFLAMEARTFLGAFPYGPGFELDKDYPGRANYVKIDGGSAGSVRYMYILNHHGERHLLEFKPIEESSLNVYHADQPEVFERSEKAFEVYWPESYPNVFKVVKDLEQTFLMRPKYKKYVNFKTKDFRKNPEDFAELSYFIAYILGQKHGKQIEDCEAFVAQLEDQFSQLVNDTQDLVEAYLKVVSDEHDRS